MAVYKNKNTFQQGKTLTCYVYLVTELDGITDNATKIQRQKSSTKFYNLINQNTETSNKIKIQVFYLNLYIQNYSSN